MRPAQKAPENRGKNARRSIRICYFNEAGAKSAGKPDARQRQNHRFRTSMRPAQKAPENNVITIIRRISPATSMRPAQKAPENSAEGDRQSAGESTSMRPAQKAPENPNSCRYCLRQCPHFNEAGAKSAGKPLQETQPAKRLANFNEAGAKSAGKPTGTRTIHKTNGHFNEAGAKSAGKHDLGRR